MPHGYDSIALQIHDFRNIYVEELRMLDIKVGPQWERNRATATSWFTVENTPQKIAKIHSCLELDMKPQPQNSKAPSHYKS